MSRGPGIWQRRILEALEQQGMVYLRDMLPEKCDKSAYNAASRAAFQLEQSGRIAITRWRWCRPTTLLHWPWLTVTERPRSTRTRSWTLNVGQGPMSDLSTTYKVEEP